MNSSCFTDLPAIEFGMLDRWGWSMGPLTAGTYVLDLWAGAGQCVLAAGTLVGQVKVTYSNNEVKMDWSQSLANVTGGKISTVQWYAGRDRIYRKPDGSYTVAPGQFPFKNEDFIGLPPTETKRLNVISGTPIYVTVHADVCWQPSAPTTLAPVATTTTAPVRPTTAPLAPTSAPLAPTSNPRTPTSAPVAPTSTPRAPTAGPVAPTAAPVPDAPSSCPLITLDFTALSNPMARYYGQNSTFQAGDYLFDQLWWTHGVKVSARILSNTHRTSDSDIFIPKFNRGTGWVDSKWNQSESDPSSGGAIRLLDSFRPNWNSNLTFRQPLCAPADNNGDGDSDLGAPNEHCPGGGPGMYLVALL